MGDVTIPADQLMLRLQLADFSRRIRVLLPELGFSADLAQAITQAQDRQRHERPMPGYRRADGAENAESLPALPPSILANLTNLHLLQDMLSRTPPERLRYADLEQGLELSLRVVEGLELELVRQDCFPQGGFTTELARAQMECVQHQAERASMAALSMLDQILTDVLAQASAHGAPPGSQVPPEPPSLPLPGLLKTAMRSSVHLPPALTAPITLPALPPIHFPEVLYAPVTLPPGLSRLISRHWEGGAAGSQTED